MRSWKFAVAAGVMLLLAGVPVSAQTPPPATPEPVDTLDLGELPPEVADEVVAFFNDPSTILVSGRTRIPAERTLSGNVASLGGPLVVAGRIEGRVMVLDGDVELAEGAAISGDLTVVGGTVGGLDGATVGGAVRLFPERPRFRWRDDRLAPTGVVAPRADERWLARGNFLIASGRSYNRVEGLPITFGPVVETGGSNPTRLRALAIYRTEAGATLDPDHMGHYLRAEQFLGGWGTLRVGGTLHSTVEPIEDWQVLNLENSLSTFLFHRDLRDHYEREGWSAFLTYALPRRPLEVTLSGRSELHRSQPSGSPWTLFRNQEAWRAQPLVAEGRVSLLDIEARYDTRNSVLDPSHGWLITGSVERTLRSRLRRPDAAVAMALPITDPVWVQGREFPSWNYGVLDVRRYNRLGPEARLNFRAMAGGSLDGNPLPPQRQHALGGEGSVPGFALFKLDCGARRQAVYPAGAIDTPVTGRFAPASFVPEYGCDQFVLLQAEYRGRFSLRFGWGGSPWGDRDDAGWDLGWAAAPDWVAFVNAAQAWGIGRPDEELALDLGVGLLFHRIGVYAALPLTREGGVNLFMRIGPRF
jgi:hypothetical protein